MADFDKLDPERAEAYRREMTQNLAKRGTFTNTAEQLQNEHREDYAEAAYAAFKGDPGRPLMFDNSPVGAAAEAQIADEDAKAALRASLLAGQMNDITDSKLGAENVRYDRLRLLADAYNAQLDRYDKGLAEREAERKAAEARWSSSGSGTWTPPLTVDETDAAPTDTGIRSGNPTSYEQEAMELIQSATNAGASWTDVYGSLYQGMVAGGVEPAEAERWIESWARAQWDNLNTAYTPPSGTSATSRHTSRLR